MNSQEIHVGSDDCLFMIPGYVFILKLLHKTVWYSKGRVLTTQLFGFIVVFFIEF